MRYKTSKRRLPGFKDNSYGTIEIQYHFPDGIQDVRFSLLSKNLGKILVFFY